MKNIGETLKKYLDKLSEKSRLGKGVVLAVVLLLSGVIMLIISEIVPEEKSASAESESTIVQSDTDEYVIVDGSSGEQGIVVRQSEPKIRGVAVVCEGGGNQTVKQQIIETVTALLDISSARVSVAKMN